jgi:hypothetical protein
MPSLAWDICNGVHRAAGGKNGTGALDGPSQARLGRGPRMVHPPRQPAARNLHAQGWSTRKIADKISRDDGAPVTHTTIANWVNRGVAGV